MLRVMAFDIDIDYVELLLVLTSKVICFFFKPIKSFFSSFFSIIINNVIFEQLWLHNFTVFLADLYCNTQSSSSFTLVGFFTSRFAE